MKQLFNNHIEIINYDNNIKDYLINAINIFKFKYYYDYIDLESVKKFISNVLDKLIEYYELKNYINDYKILKKINYKSSTTITLGDYSFKNKELTIYYNNFDLKQDEIHLKIRLIMTIYHEIMHAFLYKKSENKDDLESKILRKSFNLITLKEKTILEIENPIIRLESLIQFNSLLKRELYLQEPSERIVRLNEYDLGITISKYFKIPKLKEEFETRLQILLYYDICVKKICPTIDYFCSINKNTKDNELHKILLESLRYDQETRVNLGLYEINKEVIKALIKN